MTFLIVVYIVAALVAAAQATNYCAANLCNAGLKHIACGNNGQFATTCPKGAFLVNMVPHVNMILQMHNNKRNTIAGGNLPSYKPAKRMATIQWDNELASLAALNVKQCLMQHDKCRNTEYFKKAGQNLARNTYTGLTFSDEELIQSEINSWWNEYKECKMEYINKYPMNYSGPKIGHFTTMAIENNIRVGCAASRYSNGKQHNFLLACNYAMTNIYDRPIYLAGATASGCTKGRNSQYKNLCAIGEPYAV